MRFVMRRVLWTLVPIGSLGLLGWLPPLRIALRSRTSAAWLWCAGSVGATTLEIVLTSATERSADPRHTPASWVGWFEICSIITMAIYTGVATRILTPSPRPARLAAPAPNGYGYGYGYGQTFGHGHDRYPAQSAVYPPAPSVAQPVLTQPVATQPVDVTQPVDAAPTVAEPVDARPAVAPNALDAAAAEVQAELRELRDLLGESAGGRVREERDRRAER